MLAHDESVGRIINKGWATSVREITLTLETVTPMFLGGADPRGEPELRAPSFRGAMRYWLRALVGAAGEQTMRRCEDYLFGAVGDQATAGAVNLRLFPQASLSLQSYSELTKAQLGTAYLWFAARRTRQESERSAILPTKFDFVMSSLRSKQPAQDLEQVAAVLWLLTRLGGIGARSRRFAGGVQVAAVKSNYDPQSIIGQLSISANSPQALASDIAQGIKNARRVFGVQKPANPAPDQFDVLHPDRCQIFVLDRIFDSWQSAVEAIGSTYRSFREMRQPDYGVVKTAMTRGVNLQAAVQRAAFGLPIPFFFRSLNNRTNCTATLQAEECTEQGECINIDRRASPLWMRIVRLSNSQYTVVFTWFKSQFLPEAARLLLTKRNQPDRYGQELPNDQLIAIFLTGNDQQNRSSLKDAGYNLLRVQL